MDIICQFSSSSGDDTNILSLVIHFIILVNMEAIEYRYNRPIYIYSIFVFLNVYITKHEY